MATNCEEFPVPPAESFPLEEIQASAGPLFGVQIDKLDRAEFDRYYTEERERVFAAICLADEEA